MAEPGVRVMLPLGASPPGSASVKGIMKLSGLTDGIMKNLMAENACVISMMCDLVEGKAMYPSLKNALPHMIGSRIV